MPIMSYATTMRSNKGSEYSFQSRGLAKGLLGQRFPNSANCNFREVTREDSCSKASVRYAS